LTQAYHYLITGRIQGVGFRPYVYRLATHCGLVGWVKNLAGQLEIRVQGSGSALQIFAQQLIQQTPPLARPRITSCQPCQPDETLTEFKILPSGTDTSTHIHVPPDYFTCPDCLKELHDPNDRRYHYPFINCTQCGPRYTLIHQLPYDRPHTSLADFDLCPSCAAEYHNPQDRRFHAQPLACPHCGPQLAFYNHGLYLHDTTQALAASVQALREGKIIAVKGVGGYHLFCAADQDNVVLRLRQHKPRPAKPLAVMFPDLAAMKAHIILTSMEAEWLTDPIRPIVLARQHPHHRLSSHIAPGLNEIGVMLPYSPLHHLLLETFAAPVIATSGNLGGEPVLTDNQQAEQRLSHVADAFLHHNRPIVRPADDSVFRVIANQARPLRLGRGCAPLEFTLPTSLSRPLLAVGSHLKNTVALAWEDRVVISPHIGDLEAPRSMEVFIQTITDLQKLYKVPAQAVICDAHPHYNSSRWARQSGLPVTRVFHHHAHASAIAGEFPNSLPWLVFTWDGVGFGEDGTFWGGEALLGGPGRWQRVATFRPFHLPGNELAGREPWRSALALCWEIGQLWDSAPVETTLLHEAWQRRLNSPLTTAVGRLFDAAAALLGIITTATFEGQGPMWLEALCTEPTMEIPLPRQTNAAGIWETDWSPLVSFLLDPHFPPGERAANFHRSMALALVAQAQQLRTQYPIKQVGLSGGVFQNRCLTEQVLELLREAGFTAYLSQHLPCNDAGISFGQIIEGMAKAF